LPKFHFPLNQDITTYTQDILHELEEIPSEYYPILLKMIRLFNKSIALQPAEAGFKQGWEEVLADETYPIEELWEGIDAE
jgi:hypothetical protein